MRRQNPVLLVSLLSAVLLWGFSSVASAQSTTSDASGGSSLVVSRESDTTPRSQTAPSLSMVSVVSQQWIQIALANARVWALSFAPAPTRPAPVAVRRRAVR